MTRKRSFTQFKEHTIYQTSLQRCYNSQAMQNQKQDQPYKESQPSRKKYKVYEKDMGMMVYDSVLYA